MIDLWYAIAQADYIVAQYLDDDENEQIVESD